MSGIDIARNFHFIIVIAVREDQTGGISTSMFSVVNAWKK
jgi:hypothetical protein